ncbi:phage major capsid protein, P2 family [Pandoraea pnomenusa]|uniref:Phage major capsid protein, P2 family n=1 Tax=Pandoraea pnomenusa TaxID=93220 RepID=A0A379KDI3_9BURK|nr:phage major capsid protein, P2 family [Pandoraea pnomenusa]
MRRARPPPVAHSPSSSPTADRPLNTTTRETTVPEKHTCVRKPEIAFNGYLRQLEKLNGVETAAEKFTVVPSVQQKLETKMQESTEFLKRINIVGVTEQQGEKLGLGVGSPLGEHDQHGSEGA